MTIFILIFILSFTTLLFFILYLTKIQKYNKVMNKNKLLTEQFEDINKPIRKGHYTIKLDQEGGKDNEKKYQIECIIFVEELERYTSGESKLKFIDVNIICDNSGYSQNSARDYIRNNFRIVRKTNEVTWLESELELKEERKIKLDRIKEILK